MNEKLMWPKKILRRRADLIAQAIRQAIKSGPATAERRRVLGR